MGCFLIINFEVSLYILYSGSLLNIRFAYRFSHFVSCVLLLAVFIKAQRILTLMKSNLPVFFLLQNMFFMAYLKTFCLTQGHKFFLQSAPKFLLNFWNFDSFRFSLYMRWYIHFESFFQMMWNMNCNHLKTWLIVLQPCVHHLSFCTESSMETLFPYEFLNKLINIYTKSQLNFFYYYYWDCVGSLDNLGEIDILVILSLLLSSIYLNLICLSNGL